MGCIARVGCLMVLCIAALVGWITRDKWMSKVPGAPAPVIATAPVWQPLSPSAGEKGKRAIEAMQSPRGNRGGRTAGALAEESCRRAHREWQGDDLQDDGRRAVIRKILIVDDEQGIRAALGQLLEFEGYEVHTAANAVDGLAEYAKFKPHLVFLDVKMAGIDGLEALRTLRERDPSAVVVMISGHATIH